MARLLYLTPGPVPPSRDPEWSKYHHLGRRAAHQIDVLCPVWWKTVDEGLKRYPESTFPTVRAEAVTYHFHLEYRYPEAIRALPRIAFFLRKGKELAREGTRCDAIICYGTNTVGVAGALLARSLGVKLIVEIPGVPHKAFILDSARPTVRNRLRRVVANHLLTAVLHRTAGLHLMFPEQVPASLTTGIPVRRVFPDFVPVSQIRRSGRDERFVLFLGFPWYLKGVDLLIEAFRSIADHVPDVSLRVVGYFPDREELERRAAGHPRISIENPVKAAEAYDLAARCSVLVLPSRTDAAPRVLLEAWAAGKPIVASRVDGIPHYVTHEENGLLFECGNARDLALQMRRVLTDRECARRLGDTGYQCVRERWTEEHFREEWEALIEDTLTAPKGR